MDIFLLNNEDIDSKIILHKNLCNMHIALHNVHMRKYLYCDQHMVSIQSLFIAIVVIEQY
jgi:hypothetical protein